MRCADCRTPLEPGTQISWMTGALTADRVFYFGLTVLCLPCAESRDRYDWRNGDRRWESVGQWSALISREEDPS